MPLMHTFDWGIDNKIGIWEIADTIAHLKERIDQRGIDTNGLLMMAERKQKEWLSARLLLLSLLPEDMVIDLDKDEYGKPFLKNADWHISISHSNERSAAVVSKSCVGIDIQKFVEKIDRIANRVMSSHELAQISGLEQDYLLGLHLLWGAKEAMYKAYGRKSLDFIQHMEVEVGNFSDQYHEFTGCVKKGDYFQQFNLFSQRYEGYVLVLAQANEENKI